MATTGASLKPIYERINGVPEYHPMTADTFADWSMEAGDLVTVTRDGNSYQSPVNSTRMTWKKGQQITISSEGSEKRDPVAKISQRKYRGGGAGLRNSQYQHIHVEDMYNQLKAGLELTVSTAQLYVEDSYNKLRTALEMTSSTANLYVRNAYLQLKAGLEATSSSARLYADSKTTKAEIIARINEDGSSESVIRGDRVSVYGRTTINDVMTIADNRVQIKKPIRVEGNAMVQSLTIRDGSSSETLTQTDLAGVIKRASVSGNILTLVPVHGDPITFSKATQLSASWDGNRKFTVSASPQGVSRYTQLVSAVPQADQVWNGRNGTLTLRATIDGGESTVVAGKVTLIAPEQYPSSMSITRAITGVSNVGAVSYYGQLYYWNTLTGSYQPASSGNQYWYHSSSSLPGTNTVHY